MFLMLACAQGDSSEPTDTGTAPVTDYALRITPVVAANQSPFEGLDRLDLVFEPRTGESERISLGAPESGDTLPAEGLPALDETVIHVEGYAGGQLAAIGRTAALSGSSGEIDVSVLVTETDALAWMGALPEGVVDPIVAALGAGRFLIGGGMGSNRGNLAKGQDALYTLDVREPTAGLALDALDTMPTYVDAGETERTERMGATFTQLTAGARAGRWLLAGGSSELPHSDSLTTTDDVQVWDPESGDWDRLNDDGELVSERSQHLAMVDAQGSVVVWGGWTAAEADTISVDSTVERFDPSSDAFERVGTIKDLGSLDAAIASLGTRGTLLCGGAVFGQYDEDPYGEWLSSDHCQIVTLTGELGDVITGLPSLAGLAMATLSDGTVIATGGATQSEPVEMGEASSAESGVWQLLPGADAFEDAGEMAVARAGHRMVPLDDTRVAIFGGGPEYGAGRHPAEAHACGEIVEIGVGSTPLGDCNEASPAAGLPNRTAMPAIASDPDWGTLIVGGVDEGDASLGGEAQSGVALFVPVP